MIKSKKGKTVIKGDVVEVASDFSAITHALLSAHIKHGMTKEEAIEKLNFAFNLGLKDENEIRKEAKEKVLKLLEDIVRENKEDSENE